MGYLSSHEKQLPQKREGGGNCIMLQLWVLLATEIVEEKTSQIVLRNLYILGEAQLNTVLHLFKIHRTNFVKLIGGRVAHKLKPNLLCSKKNSLPHYSPAPQHVRENSLFSP